MYSIGESVNNTPVKRESNFQSLSECSLDSGSLSSISSSSSLSSFFVFFVGFFRFHFFSGFFAFLLFVSPSEDDSSVLMYSLLLKSPGLDGEDFTGDTFDGLLDFSLTFDVWAAPPPVALYSFMATS